MNDSRSVRVVLVDVGGTLLRVRHSVGTVYATTAAEHGVDVEASRLDLAFRSAWSDSLERRRRRRFACSDELLREEWRWIVERTFGDVVPPNRMSALFEDLYARFASADAWDVAPNARANLSYLRTKGVRLGVFSNWDSRLARTLEELDLASAFDFQVVSHAVGVEKPHPDMFRVALDRGGGPPSATVVVGDSYEADIAAARALGLRTIWMTKSAPDGGADDQIDGFPGDPASYWAAWIAG